MKKKSFIIITAINIAALLFVLFSYYIKKHTGYALYNFAILFFMVAFLLYSLILAFSFRKLFCYVEQALACLLIFLMVKFNLPDRFALLIEIPRFEKKIEVLKKTGVNDCGAEIIDGCILFDWEPGFLDWQMVLVYDEQDSLQNVMEEKKYVQEGRFYVLYKAKKCFYMCAANR